MKKFFRMLTALCLSGTILMAFDGCKKSDDSNDNSACPDKQVTATIDGSFQSCTVVASNNTYYTQIHAMSDATVSANFKQIIIQFWGDTVGTYALGDASTTGVGTGTYAIGAPTPDQYQTDATHSGTITITKADKTAKLISGTFSFTGVKKYPTPTSDTKSVTSGSFTDVKW